MSKKIKDVFFILVLGSLCTLSLLWIKAYTYPKIARYEELKLKTTILDAAGIYYTLENPEAAFDENIEKRERDNFTYYLTPDELFIFEFEGRGLWGMIQGVITLHPDLETIEAIRIISQEETPGLGARIAEEDYLNQFNKKRVAPKLNLILRVKSSGDNEIDAISGASLTSAALVDMVSEAVINFRNLIEG